MNYFLDNILNDYDIVCLQEVFRPFQSRKECMIDKARKLGFAFHAADKTPGIFNRFAADSGLLILSRFPIVQQEVVHFPVGLFSDSMARKGVMYAKIKI